MEIVGHEGLSHSQRERERENSVIPVFEDCKKRTTFCKMSLQIKQIGLIARLQRRTIDERNLIKIPQHAAQWLKKECPCLQILVKSNISHSSKCPGIDESVASANPHMGVFFLSSINSQQCVKYQTPCVAAAFV